jgi:hypothetical protein
MKMGAEPHVGTVKGKDKAQPRIGYKGPERCSLSLTSVLDVGGWSILRSGRFNPGKIPGTHYRMRNASNTDIRY